MIRARPLRGSTTSLKKSAWLRLPAPVMQAVPSRQVSLKCMGCGAASTWWLTGALLFACVTWLKYSCHVCPTFALGPSEPSCFRVLFVPYQATSMMPGALPAATHGNTLTVAGGLLIWRGVLQVRHSLSAPGFAQEYQTLKVLSSTQTA